MSLSCFITLNNWDTHSSRWIMLWWTTLWYIWKSTFMSTLRWYSKWSILHLNMLTLVFEFVLKIEMAISKYRSTHLHFWWYLFYGVTTCYPSGHIWYKSDFPTLLLDEILNFAWFSHRQALKTLHRKLKVKQHEPTHNGRGGGGGAPVVRYSKAVMLQ